MKKDLILFGVQGSGKGTQAKLLLEQLDNHKYLEMGQIFRALNSNENIIGKYVNKVMTHGGLVKDSVTSSLFQAGCKTLEQDEYLLIDGFPRKQEQMQDMIKIFEKEERDYICILFELSKEVAIQRIMKRAQEQGRKDDTPEAIEKRIGLFYSETTPVIEYFEKLRKVIKVNADNDIDTIFNELKEKLHIQ